MRKWATFLVGWLIAVAALMPMLAASLIEADQTARISAVAVRDGPVQEMLGVVNSLATVAIVVLACVTFAFGVIAGASSVNRKGVWPAVGRSRQIRLAAPSCRYTGPTAFAPT